METDLFAGVSKAVVYITSSKRLSPFFTNIIVYIDILWKGISLYFGLQYDTVVMYTLF